MLSSTVPRDVPSVDPSTLGRKTLYELASLKYCYNPQNEILQIHSHDNNSNKEGVFIYDRPLSYEYIFRPWHAEHPLKGSFFLASPHAYRMHKNANERGYSAVRL